MRTTQEVSRAVFAAELYPVTTAAGEKRSSSETPGDHHVGMLSHKALSVSDLQRGGERDRKRDEKQTD